MRVWMLLLALAGCGGGDPCDAFPDETCIAVEVRGDVGRLDQLRMSSAEMHIGDKGTPEPLDPFDLPVVVPVLPGPTFSGSFELLVRGVEVGTEKGRDSVRGVVDKPGAHSRLVAVLVAGDDPDLAGLPGIDLSGVDLAGVDLSGADLSTSDLASGNAPTWHLEDIPMTDGLNTVWGSGPNDVYAVGYKGLIIHSTGNGVWTGQPNSADSANDTFWGVFGTGPGDIFASVSNRAFHSIGNGTWQEQTVVTRSGALDFRSVTRLFGFPGKIYAAGTSGAPVYFSTGNGTWTPQGTAASDLTMEGVWGSGPSDLFVVGRKGPSTALLLRSSGDGNWTEEATGSTAGLSSIFGLSKNDIYIANFAGEVFHSTGNGVWMLQPTPLADIAAIWASAPDDLWAVGNEGIARSTGDGNWVEEPKPANLLGFFAGRGVFGFARDDVYVVGSKDGVLHFHR